MSKTRRRGGQGGNETTQGQGGGQLHGGQMDNSMMQSMLGLAGASNVVQGPQTHTVVAGENLSVIAEKYGVSVQDIVRANGLRNPSAIAVGQELTIPAQGAKQAQGNDNLEVVPAALQAAVDAMLPLVPQALRSHAQSSLPIILKQAADQKVTSANHVAYILATTEGEGRFGAPLNDWTPSLEEGTNYIRERQDGSFRMDGIGTTGDSSEDVREKYFNHKYGGRSDLGNQGRNTDDGFDFRGRGYAQITGRANYEKFTKICRDEGFSYTIGNTTYEGDAIDLGKNPDHVAQSKELAAFIMVYGMREGTFTGVGLDDKVSNRANEGFTEGRRIINGTDRAADFAAVAKRYAPKLRELWPKVHRPKTNHTQQ